MPKSKSNNLSIHFIGIGGIGISALARWFLAQGWAVSGSDLTGSDLTTELKKEGVEIKIGHKKSNLPKEVTMAVYSNAITASSPGYIEFEEAEKTGIRPMSYPQTLGCLTEVYKTIAIAGSHGKSTTTALIGLTLKNSSIDPTIVVGTKLKELHGKNFHLGKTKWLVIEADEWRGAFLHYHPDIAVVTNIDKEHLDFYRDLNDLKKTFLKFLARTKSGGSLVLNRDDKNLFSLSPLITKIAKAGKLKVFWYSLKDKKTALKIKKSLQLPGLHNLSNAMAAATVTGRILKLKEGFILKELGKYQGAWRRMEYRGNMNPKTKVFDDYAHHPSEIKATLQAFREKFPKSNIVCVYQAHQAKRLKALYKDFIGAFSDADSLVFLPTYEVAGRDNKEKEFTSEKLAQDISKKEPEKKVVYLKNPQKIKSVVEELLTTNPYPLTTVVMMGAGTVVNYTPLLLS
ncbi:MAG: UDP-N-acetylmuramate--L-alanine ligase [Patescibacteria group bacterium]